MAIALVDIFAARNNIKNTVQRTPIKYDTELSKRTNGKVFLKLESYQHTGSFKLRGATNAIAKLPKQQPVITASTGNHGLALAYAARQYGTKATICLSNLVPTNKVKAIKNSGAELLIHGDSQDEAIDLAIDLAKQKDMALIPPFDDLDVIVGQGTLGLEIIEQLPDTASIIVPLSGGGLLAGIAIAAKNINPKIRIIGVTMENGCAMHNSLLAGHPVLVKEQATLADSLGGGIGLDNHYSFNLVNKYCDESVLTSEESIAKAIIYMYQQHQEIVEGAAAVGIAAFFDGALDKYSSYGPMIILISGKNIAMLKHQELIRGAT